MSKESNIDWCDASLVTKTGCDKISPGCINCYAMELTDRLQAMGQTKYTFGRKFTEHPEVCQDLYKWKKPKKIFIDSMSDIFHEKASEVNLNLLVKAMLDNPQHTYIILTKRPDSHGWRYFERVSRTFSPPGIPENWWIGVTAENQDRADFRLHHLSMMPCRVKFVSVEPMLEHVDLRPYLKWLDWVIIGCESGPARRHIDIGDMLDLVIQCKEANVPVFVKQAEIKGVFTKNPKVWDNKPLQEFPREKLC